jgi:hypothetical protein
VTLKAASHIPLPHTQQKLQEPEQQAVAVVHADGNFNF